MRIALFGKEFNADQLGYFHILVEALESRGCKLLIWKPFHEFLKDKIGPDDVVIAIGAGNVWEVVEKLKEK